MLRKKIIGYKKRIVIVPVVVNLSNEDIYSEARISIIKIILLALPRISYGSHKIDTELFDVVYYRATITINKGI